MAILVILGLSGWMAFTLYQQHQAPKVTAEPPVPPRDERLESFVDQGRALLAKGELAAAKEQFQKASGVNEADLRVQEGLAMVAVLDIKDLSRIAPGLCTNDLPSLHGQRVCIAPASARTTRAISCLGPTGFRMTAS